MLLSMYVPYLARLESGVHRNSGFDYSNIVRFIYSCTAVQKREATTHDGALERKRVL